MLNKHFTNLPCKATKQHLTLIMPSALFILLIFSFASLAQPNAQTLNLCVDPDWMPFEGVINGEHTGIASDYLAIFSQLPLIHLILNKPALGMKVPKNLNQGHVT